MSTQAPPFDELGLPEDEFNALPTPESEQPPEPPQFDEADWVKRGEDLAKSDTDVRWALGKWLLEGERGLPNMDIPQSPCDHEFKFYTYASSITGLAPGHLRDLASTANRVNPSVRTDKLTWSHHRMVINELPEVDDETFRGWLKKAEDEGLSVVGLQKAIRGVANPGGGRHKPAVTEKSFIVTVPLSVYEALEDLAKAEVGMTLNRTAGDILTEHCAQPEVQAMREWAKSEGEKRAHDAMSRNGRMVARNYNPLGLEQ